MVGIGGINGDIPVNCGVGRTRVWFSGIIGDFPDSAFGIGDTTIRVHNSGGGGITAHAGKPRVTNDARGGIVNVPCGDVVCECRFGVFLGGVIYGRSIVITGGVIISDGKKRSNDKGTCLAS